ncbi:MAG: 16S rRNA (adenine(1518)-N(6)/adenine(1519)-N(6))-dimethyltransferase RsmA [Firmicutes bacterium]|mgnify:CR=1 FL=1|nr:16S rRNA (adenine(1518)-N(6)/adenine(1519)-N(6))-dimethyltransferase RsmA [Bacillota bacterium]
MSKLTNPAYVSSLLARYGIRLRKKWGQNFLVDENILNKIVAVAELTKEDTVLEIGPGIGALTEKLAQQAGKVTALEIDERLLPILNETLAGFNNVTILHQDAMKADYQQLLAEKPIIVANLPYNVATPLFYRWLKEYRRNINKCVCMVQKEVAQRLVASPGGKDYGTLSVVARYGAAARIAFEVPRTVFFPRPEVTSAVVELLPYQTTMLSEAEESCFFRVVDAVFAQRRKTALNTLQAAFKLSKAEIAELGCRAGIDLSRRGETLNEREFAELAKLFYNKINANE